MWLAKKWLERVGKRTFRPVANLMHHPLSLTWILKGSMFGKVVKQTIDLVKVMVGEDELDVYGKYLEQLMPDPGDKAKMLQKARS